MSRTKHGKQDTWNSFYTHNFDFSHAAHELDRQKQLLYTVNTAATVLLSEADEEKFESSLLESMELLARCLDVDRINVWRNETRNGVIHYVMQYGWMNGVGIQGNYYHPGDAVPYRPDDGKSANGRTDDSDNASNETQNQAPDAFGPGGSPPEDGSHGLRISALLNGKCLDSSVSSLPHGTREWLEHYGVKSVLIIPVFTHESLWGFVRLDDCHRERVFTKDEIGILRSASLMIVSAVTRNAHAAEIHAAHERAKLMLDATPLVCSLWDKDANVFDCNEEAVKFFQLRDKKEFLDRFFDFSPEFQPDGQSSKEQAHALIRKVFEDGRCVKEWTHQLLDGTPLPVEVTLVRVSYEDDYIIAAYVRDLRQYRQMIKAIEHKTHLLDTVNRVANILLKAEVDDFRDALWYCMSLLAEAVDADRVYIWENHTIEGRLHCTQIYEWSEGAEPQQGNKFTTGISYGENIPTWEKILSNGHCVNGPVRGMPHEEQAQLLPQGILSVLVVPVHLHNSFWGFMGFDDCRKERVFSKDEESILRSACLLVTHALLRNDMTRSVRTTAARLNAVITNYPGIILSVDSNCVITLLNGLQIGRLGIESAFAEGKTLDAVFTETRYSETIAKIRETFTEGAQDWISGINGAVFHMRTTPILDESGRAAGVVCNIDDITDIIRLQSELESALSKAQSANRAKSNFLARISHEMRTPLNAIMGLSELSLANGGLDAETASNIEKIYRAGNTLLGTVDDLLDVSKIEAGRLELAPNEYGITSLRRKHGMHAQPAPVSLPDARILVVDDIAVNLDVAKGMLKQYGMQVDCVNGGQQAIDAVRNEKVRYDAIFMDHMMPDMDGIKAARIIHEEIGTEYARNVPIIALTANAFPGNKENFFKNGFQDFLSKPIETASLDAVIRKWVLGEKTEESPAGRHTTAYEQTPPDWIGEKNSDAVLDRRSGMDRRQTSDKKIAWLDVEKGMQRFGGNKESYMQILRSFASSTRSLLDAVRGVTGDDLADYAITVHGIKGSSRGISADVVGNMAEALEKAAKAGNFDFVCEHNQDFIKTVYDLITDIDGVLGKMAEKNPKPKKDRPDIETLTELLVACKEYDMDGVDEAMEKIENFEYESGYELAAWLRTNVDCMNFAQIEEKLLSLEDVAEALNGNRPQ